MLSAYEQRQRGHSLAVWYKGHWLLRTRPSDQAKPLRARKRKPEWPEAPTPLPTAPATPTTPKPAGPWRPPPTHPWRRGFKAPALTESRSS